MSAVHELESLPILIEAILRCFFRQSSQTHYAAFMEAALDGFIRAEVRGRTPNALVDKFATPQKAIDHFLAYLENIRCASGHRTARPVMA